MIQRRGNTSSILSLIRFSSVIGLLPSSIAMLGTCSGICSVTKSGETFSKSTSILPNGLVLKRAHFDVIDSSQTRCKEICSDSSKELLKDFFDMDQYTSETLYLLTADTQTSSYGRSNRTWHSVQGNFQGTPRELPGNCQGTIRELRRKFQGTSKELPGNFQGSTRGLPQNFQ